MKWIDNYKLCIDGVCNQIDEYRSQGLSVREAARKMSEKCGGEFTDEHIMSRYKYYSKGQRRGKEGWVLPTTLTDDETLVNAAEIRRMRDTDRIKWVGYLTKGCETHCDDFDGCRARLMSKPYDELKGDYEIVVKFWEALTHSQEKKQ